MSTTILTHWYGVAPQQAFAFDIYNWLFRLPGRSIAMGENDGKLYETKVSRVIQFQIVPEMETVFALVEYEEVSEEVEAVTG